MENKKRLLMIVVILTIIVTIMIIGINIINQNRRKYDIEEIKDFKYYTIVKDGKTGVIDTKGNILIEPKFETIKIPNPSKAIFVCIFDYNTNSGEYKTKVINEKNEEIFSEYENISAVQIKEVVSNIPYEKSVLKFEKNNKYGLIDFNGKIIVKPIYDEISNISYKEGELLVKKDEKYGVINIKGTQLIDIKYDSVVGDNYYSQKDGYKLGGYIVGNKIDEGYRYGYIGSNGKILLDIEYNKLYRITEIEDDKSAYIVAEKNGKAGLTKDKKVIIDYLYEEIEYDEINKVCVIKKDNKYGLIDLNGNAILKTEYDNISVEGIYIYADKENKELVFDINGNIKESPKYKNVISTDNDKYNITIDNDDKYGVEDKDGQVLVPSKYYYIEYIYEDYFIVAGEEGKTGIVNSKNQVIIDILYDVVQKIENTDIIQTLISDTGKLALYNKNMAKIISMDNGKIFVDNDYIKVYSQTETKYIDKNGKEKQNKEIFINNTILTSQKDGKWGFTDKDGNIKIEYSYDKATEFNKYGYAGIKKDGKWGVVAEDGTVLVQPSYILEEIAGEPDFIGKYYKVVSGYGEIYYTDDID